MIHDNIGRVVFVYVYFDATETWVIKQEMHHYRHLLAALITFMRLTHSSTVSCILQYGIMDDQR